MWIHFHTSLGKAGRPHTGLAEDVFHFVEDGGVAVGGLIVHLQRSVELLHELALLARELAGGEDAHMIVEIAATAAMWIGKALALDAKDRATLRTFGNLEPLFAREA